MKSPGRIDQNDIHLSGRRRFERIIGNRCGIGSFLVFDDFGAGSLGPDHELFDGGGAKGVGGGDQDLFAGSRGFGGQFSTVVVLPTPLTPTTMMICSPPEGGAGDVVSF
jgi:hypothetical protein